MSLASFVQIGLFLLVLVLLVVESTQSLSISIRYNAELFDPPTVVAFANDFKTLLEHVVERPEVRLSELAGVLRASRREQHAAAQKDRREINLRKLHSARRRATSAV